MRKIDIADVASLPPTPGSYLLLLEIDDPIIVHVGRLGPLIFSPGTWLYAGSAWGHGGVRARVARHFRLEKKRHWHIDALSLVQPPVAAYVELQSELQSELQVNLTIRLECLWIQRLLTLPEMRSPHPGFGSSDCIQGCVAHLVCTSDVTLDWARVLQE
ncbi:DUF123 domain-containing protein [bacterium]|nr:DUF123 domain-containing protein [bacterium]